MNQRVALSASFSDDSLVAGVLETCDYIYTTQAKNYETLCRRFPNSEIRCIPCSTQEMIDLIKSWHPGEEFVDYSDLHKIHRG